MTVGVGVGVGVEVEARCPVGGCAVPGVYLVDGEYVVRDGSRAYIERDARGRILWVACSWCMAHLD